MGQEGVRCRNKCLFYAYMMYTGPLLQLKLLKNHKKVFFLFLKTFVKMIGFLTKFVGFHVFFVHFCPLAVKFEGILDILGRISVDLCWFLSAFFYFYGFLLIVVALLSILANSSNVCPFFYISDIFCWFFADFHHMVPFLFDFLDFLYIFCWVRSIELNFAHLFSYCLMPL